MKKGIIMILAAFLLFSATGCSALREAKSLLEPTETVFSIPNCSLQITADSTFEEKTGGSFDLQIKNDESYISVMAFHYIDLPENVTPWDIFEIQNEELFGKRTAVTVLEEATTLVLSNRTVTKALHSAEKDGVKNYYATHLVDIPDAEICAWVLVTAMPSYWSQHGDDLYRIVCSLTSVK